MQLRLGKGRKAMTKEYRDSELANATSEWMQARARREAATTRKAKTEADEAIEFWSNKMAFLQKAR